MADLIKAWPTKNAGYDLIVCNLVLGHTEDLSHIYSEAFRSLQKDGQLYISEMNPFWHCQAGKARLQRDAQINEVRAFVYHVTNSLQAAATNNFSLESFNEYWHTEDQDKPLRLAVFKFVKA